MYPAIHSRFGVVAEKALKKIQIDHRAWFILGCQGPDVFYHSQMTRPVALEYGALLHRRGYGIFTAALLKMALPDPPPNEEDIRMLRREKGISPLGAYALGFMTHAILDRLAHPYIVYKSGPVFPARAEAFRRDHPPALGKNTHAFFERIIDVLMLDRLRGRPIASWDQEAMLVSACEAPTAGLKELLARALIAAFPERAGGDTRLRERMENTFLDCTTFYRYTDPGKTSIRRGACGDAPPDWLREIPLYYLYPENLPRHIDYLNLAGRTWFSPGPGGQPDSRPFPAVYADAVRAAADGLSVFIAQYLETGIFPIKEAAQTIGNGGLSIQDETGKPCAPVRTGPLPLDEVLAHQKKLREKVRVLS
ncbi:MAG: zinc dependent phospholipase C family protein [Spirochaetaceae bacterium]|jgi:hypothetical protein|nr:zinc dependent phospholipase C family protein [Spirochaetaceae bacterium]